MCSSDLDLLTPLSREGNRSSHSGIAEDADEHPSDHLLVRGAGRCRLSVKMTLPDTDARLANSNEASSSSSPVRILPN